MSDCFLSQLSQLYPEESGPQQKRRNQGQRCRELRASAGHLRGKEREGVVWNTALPGRPDGAADRQPPSTTSKDGDEVWLFGTTAQSEGGHTRSWAGPGPQRLL